METRSTRLDPALSANMDESRQALKLNSATLLIYRRLVGNRGRGRGMWSESTDRNLFREAIARKQFQGPMQGKLLRMPRRGLTTDNHLSLDLLDDEVADASVRQLANLGCNPLRQARSGVKIV
jgi:hypothetical protein